MRTATPIILMFLIHLAGWAQSSYVGSNGTVIISTTINNHPVNFRSNEVKVLLDYESTKLTFTIDKATLEKVKSNKSTRDKDTLKPSKIRYEGDLNLEYIKTVDHPTLPVKDEGVFIFDDDKSQRLHVIGEGFLTHVSSTDEKACILSVSYIIPPENKTRSIVGEPSSNMVRIELIHTVLEKTRTEWQE